MSTTNASPNVESKTKSSTKKPSSNFETSNVKNVLSKYRSYTYNFTLAALNKNAVNDPKKYRDSALDYIILQSGGKGNLGISTNVAGVVKKVGENKEVIREGGRTLGVNKTNIYDIDRSGDKLVESFNKSSSGKFDFYIEDVEIENLMAFKQNSSTSLPTSIKFDVIEPYSINGFIEALHVSAVAAGYPTYTQASFILKLDFIGYPDDADLPVPAIVPNSSRYFVLGFTGVEVELTEKGTRYRCAAVPFNEKGFGKPNVLKKPTPMAGNTVQEILEDLMKNINNQTAKMDKDSKEDSKEANKHNIYKIKFPTRDLNSETGWDYDKINDIGKSKISELLKDNALYKFPDPGTTTVANSSGAVDQKQPSPEQKAQEPVNVAYTYTPGKPQVQFSEGAAIHELIASVIRDSEYVKKILTTLGTAENPDEYGFINYFIVKLEVKNLDVIDNQTKKPYQEFTYIVTPYKIHFTKIPGYASLKIDEKKISRLVARTYHYLYSGQNVDVTNFKLNFNTLFFEAMPAALGNNDQLPTVTGAAPGGDVVPKQAGSTAEQPPPDSNGQPVQQVTEAANAVQATGGNAGPVSTDPYAILAKNMHNAIINSNASMITGDLEIVGDPFFLVTGGIGNYNPKPVSRGIAGNGEADHNYGEVLISVIFNNPTDYSSFEEGGSMYFDENKVPFSGVYRVIKVVNRFTSGEFKQKLEIIRVPGQLAANVPISDPANKIKTTPNKNDFVVPDTTVADAPSSRPTSANLLLQLGRGLPSPGLPGILSNFVGLKGGLGGSANNLLNQVSGAINGGINKLTSANGIFGGSIPGGVNQLASGIRLSAAGLIGMKSASLSPAALLDQASNTLKSVIPVAGEINSLANNINSKITAAKTLVSVPGSGIGEGATFKIDSTSVESFVDKGTKTVTDLFKQTAIVPAGVTAIAGLAAGLDKKSLSSVAELGSKASGLANDVKNKVFSITDGKATDPTALASKFGINMKQLSGLSNDLKSKVLDQVSNLSKQIPQNTDLSAATAQGLVLDYIPASKLANIPATAPFVKAPIPETDKEFLKTLVSKGGKQALANAFGVSDVSKISSDLLPTNSVKDILTSSPAKLNNPLSKLSSKLPGVTSIVDKFKSAENQIAAVAGIVGSVEGKISNLQQSVGSIVKVPTDVSKSVVIKYGSSSSDASPLSKLIGGS
jgi:hypothetical protein